MSAKVCSFGEEVVRAREREGKKLVVCVLGLDKVLETRVH